VAKNTRPMPREWLNAAGNDINSSAVLPYLRPIVGDLPAIGQLVFAPPGE